MQKTIARHEATGSDRRVCWVIADADAESQADDGGGGGGWHAWRHVNGRRMAFVDRAVASNYMAAQRRLSPERRVCLLELPLVECLEALELERRAAVGAAYVRYAHRRCDSSARRDVRVEAATFRCTPSVPIEGGLRGVAGGFFAVDADSGREWVPALSDVMACCAMLVGAGGGRSGQPVGSSALLDFLGHGSP
jgi:hypothetical protein